MTKRDKKKIELVDRIIAIYGFEHEITITFCKFAEKCDDLEVLETIVKSHEEYPVFEEEEDED